MSHGVTRRAKESPEAAQVRRQRELGKIQQYTALTNQVLGRRNARDFSQESLDLTKQLLAINPEFYTVWNYRRHILSNGIFPNKTAKEINDILAGDLALTTAALRQHPKVYWIWNHRRWCLENVPDGPNDDDQNGWRKSVWAQELYVVEKMLDADARNYHAWSYRRYVLARSYAPGHSLSQELAYTTRKIQSNFSNFSAWHQRSKIYLLSWENDIVGETERSQMRDREFDLVKQAMYTDPADQSVWLYHRWLIGLGEGSALLEREITGIEELLELEPESKWCLDTLVHYKSLLLRHNFSDTLAQECMNLLSKLRQLDPFRKGRYTDMESEMTKLRDKYCVPAGGDSV